MTLEGDRGGDTFDHDRDYARLNAQHLRVYEAMKDHQWRTLQMISGITGDPEASISARLRDFRKAKFGKHWMIRRHIEGGLWEYRLFWNPKAPEPEREDENKDVDGSGSNETIQGYQGGLLGFEEQGHAYPTQEGTDL